MSSNAEQTRTTHHSSMLTESQPLHLIYSFTIYSPSNAFSVPQLDLPSSILALKSEITLLGSSAPKRAVPATITFEPAFAQHPTVPGPTPPSTWMSMLGKRVRSSATLGTQAAMNFCPPLPVKRSRRVSLK